MKTALVVFGCIFAIVMLLVMPCISISNQEASLRVTITQKQEANKAEFDNMFKKILQIAQVTEEQKKALSEIFNGYAQARGGSQENDKLIFKWVTESVPNVDVSVYKNLQNVISSSRDAWTMRQVELLDLKREHDKMLKTFPSGMILGFLGRLPIDVVIVTSTRTQKAFEDRKDDDINLFSK